MYIRKSAKNMGALLKVRQHSSAIFDAEEQRRQACIDHDAWERGGVAYADSC